MCRIYKSHIDGTVYIKNIADSIIPNIFLLVSPHLKLTILKKVYSKWTI